MRKWLLAAGVACIIIAAALWWSHGGQHWAAYQTGTYCGSTGERYCYWSGFGSVFPWSMFALGGVFTAVGLFWRHTNCHVKGCPRIGRYQLAGGEYKVCGHHHPGFEGHHPTLDHMWQRHLEHKERSHA